MRALTWHGRHDVRVDSIALPGATLEDHWGNGASATLTKLTERPWSIVVLQDHSLRPLDDRDRFVEFGLKMCRRVKEVGARPVLFGTWARAFAPQRQEALDQAYLELAERCGAQLVPVGNTWSRVAAEEPKVPLYAPDQSHPSATGSYLAALAFFANVFQENPKGLPSFLSKQDQVLVDLRSTPRRALLLQRAAWNSARPLPRPCGQEASFH